MKSAVLLWPFSPGPAVISTAKIFKNGHWFWMLILKPLEKLIFFFNLEVSKHFHSSGLV